MSSWTHAVTGGSWYYNSDNTEIGLPIFTIDAIPSLSSYIQSPDMTNVKLFWKFPQTASINFYLPYPNIYVLEPDLSNVRLMWQIKHNKNYGLPFITEYDNSGAFARCSNLSSVIIPKTVSKIDYYAFEGCSSLATAKFSANTLFYDTSFPPSCELHFDIAGLTWCPCGLDSSGQLYETITRLSESEYLPIHQGYVGFRPDVAFPTVAKTVEWTVMWYHDLTFLGYDDFAPLTTYRPVREGANRYRFGFRYTDDSTIDKSELAGTKELLWLVTPTSTTNITDAWINKSCSTSDGTTLSTDSTILFCSTYKTLLSDKKLFSIDAMTINGDKLDYEIFIWTDSTFDGVYDYASSGVCHNLEGNKLRIQLKKHDNSSITPDELAYARINWY